MAIVDSKSGARSFTPVTGENETTKYAILLKHIGLTAMLLYSYAINAQDRQQDPSSTKPPATTKSGLAIEEVIVTVSKRQESLQEVLGSVSAISSDTLQRNNIQDLNSLVELIPGMVAQDEENIAIRGISRTRNGPSPVAFHVNDVFIATRGEPFYDLGAIEILRGPSGTLFGRNATAGAVNAKWQRPDATWGIGGDARYSGLKDEQVRAYLNIPFLGEDDTRLLGRFAVFKRRGDGTIDNLLASDAGDPGNVNDQFFRLFLTSEVTDNLQLALRAIRYESNPKGTQAVFSPTLETRRSGQLEELGAQPLPNDVTKVRSRIKQVFGKPYSESTRIDGDVTWAMHDLPLFGDVDMVLVGGQMRGDIVIDFDLDGTEEPIVDTSVKSNDDIRRTAELRFASHNNNGLDWLFGLFWYKQTSTTALHVDARTLIAPSGLGVGPSFTGEPKIVVDVDVDVDGERRLDQSKAAFLNVDMDLAQLFDLPQVTISVGVRQNRDTFGLTTPRSDITLSVPRLPGFNIPAVQSRNLKQFAEFDETTGELGARWFYSDEGMFYTKFARGYKPGLAQRVDRADGTSVQNPVDPEFLNALEAGWKTSFFDRSLQMNIAAYHYDYTDLQVSQITPGGVLTDNAGSSTIDGFEVELHWSPTAAFYLQASAAWTDATYDKYCGTDTALGEVQTDPGCTDANPTSFAGARMTAAPEYSAALLASYTFNLSDFGTLTPSIRSSWSDELDRRGLGNPNDTVRSHSTSDARLTWESPRQYWSVSAFVENIEDNNDIFFSAFTPIAVGAKPDTFSLSNNIPPRIYGISLEARF